MADSEVQEGSGQARDGEGIPEAEAPSKPAANEAEAPSEPAAVAVPSASRINSNRNLAQHRKRKFNRNNSKRAPKTNKATCDAYQAQNPQVPEATTATTNKQTKAQTIRSQASKITHLENTVEVLSNKVTKHEKNEARMLQRIKTLQLNSKTTSTIPTNQRKASRLLIKQKMEEMEQLNESIKKIEGDASKDLEDASHTLIEMRRKHQHELREERLWSKRSKTVQKNKMDKEMDDLVVEIKWDAMPDIEGYQEGTEEGEEEESDTVVPDTVVLLPNNWRERSDKGWRMDIDVQLFDNFYLPTDVLVDADAFEEEDGKEDVDKYDVDASDSEDDFMYGDDKSDGK